VLGKVEPFVGGQQMDKNDLLPQKKTKVKKEKVKPNSQPKFSSSSAPSTYENQWISDDEQDNEALSEILRDDVCI
jgi:hypothetical protein